MDLCVFGKFQPQQPVYYLQLWNEATSRGSDGAPLHFYLTWMLLFTPLLPFIFSFYWALAFQVFEGYVDDCRNTDNAWVEKTVLNIHLDRKSPVITEINNMVRIHQLFPLVTTEFSFGVFDLLLFNTTGGRQARRAPVAGAKRQEQPHDGPSRLSPTSCWKTLQEVLMSSAFVVHSVFVAFPLILLSSITRWRGRKSPHKKYTMLLLFAHMPKDIYMHVLPRHCDK